MRALALVLAATITDDATAQTARLTQPGAAPGQELAYALAVDGVRIAAGAAGEAQRTGAAYIYQCPGGICSAATRIAPLDLASGDLFGSSLALSGDTLALSAPGQHPGAVYVYVWVGSTWAQQARIVPSGSGAGFGSALALQGDRLVVGADQADVRSGAVYVYARSAGAWTEQARLTAADAAVGDGLGASIALSGDTLLAGAPQRAGAVAGSYAQGAAYVYTYNLGSWTQQSRLTDAAGASADGFGKAVSLVGDRAVIGAPLAGGGGGRAFVYERSGASWTQQAQLSLAGAAVGDRFGWSVALAGDSALIGAPYALASCGASQLFVRNGAGNWTRAAATVIATPSFGNLAGWSVAASGGRYAVGAPGFAGVAEHRGAVYWFDPLEQVFGDSFDADAASACVVPAL